MFEILQNLPAYSPKRFTCPETTYKNLTKQVKTHLAGAMKLYQKWWETDNNTVYELALEELEKVCYANGLLLDTCRDDVVIDRYSKRCTFMLDLAVALLGDSPLKHG